MKLHANPLNPIGMLAGALLLAPGFAPAGEPMERPVLIGVLNQSWGPSPSSVGLRDGLMELGYRENEDFVLGVRFTQGDERLLAVAAQ